MIRNEPSDSAAESARKESGPRPLRWRFLLGVLILAVAAGSVVFLALLGDVETTVGLLVVVLGGSMSGTLIGEYVSERFRGVMFGCHLHPAVELLVAYGLVAVVLLAILGGHFVLAAVSGALLVCTFAAMILEDGCFATVS